MKQSHIILFISMFHSFSLCMEGKFYRNFLYYDFLYQENCIVICDWHSKKIHKKFSLLNKETVDFVHSEFGDCTREAQRFDPPYMDLLIKNCPKRLREHINLLKFDKMHKTHYLQRKFILLKGDTGTGKTCLAQAIGQYCDIPITRVLVPFIHNRFINSELINLNKVFSRVYTLPEPQIVILDTIESLIRDNGCDRHALHCVLDFLKAVKHKNIIVIGIGTDIKRLPQDFLDRFSIFTINKPDKDIRKQIISYYLSCASSYMHIDVNDSDLERCARRTSHCSPRDLEAIIEKAYRDVEFSKHEKNEPLVLKGKNILDVIREDEPLTLCSFMDRYIRPNIIGFLHFVLPFALILNASYYTHK